MRKRSAALALGPRPLYPVKAAATRARSLLWLLTTRGQIDPGGLRILFYHRVSADDDELAVTPQRFREQMDLLAKSGFEVVDVVEAASRLYASGPAPPRRLIGLSFDDGYLDVAEEALPVLERCGFRATVFVATGLIEGTAPLAWYKHPPPLLRWAEIVDLDRLGTLRFEAHSVTHRNLVQLDDDEARWEILESKRTLADRLGRRIEVFCYPGGVSGEARRWTRLGSSRSHALPLAAIRSTATQTSQLTRIQVEVGAMEGAKVETCLRSTPCQLASSAAQLGIGNQSAECRRKGIGVARGDDEPAVGDQLANAADLRADDGKSGRHGLEDRQGEPLGPAREDEYVGLRHEAGDVVSLAEQLHAIIDPEPPNLRLESLPIGTIPDDPGAEGLSLEPRQGSYERREVLRFGQTADAEHRREGSVVAGPPRPRHRHRGFEHHPPLRAAD